ncbi:glycosyltransferase family 2 protein [Bythopirellula polymerisocia]|uniref:Putative glycosyltransferase EpsE n=1 Tax=Bythopirellula polymerisocia TaxID=2528003 RepID=A0A5C6CBR9_9BACT|nr:glycosyltransferase family 2 protein [Bythopirellula polymerisocia]TWU20874.1 putative glycosyltransferase EpsE [Bythopirellula polymerisocia]
MANSEPRVSIGLPVYNGETYLGESIESLLGQTYGDFELIISDNGSTDGTQEICSHYAKLDSRIAYHRVKQNLGCAWNYNRVFELSQAEYFKWAADDDIHLPTFLEKAVDVLDHHPEVLWCFCRHSHIGPEGQLLNVAEGLDASLLSGDGWDRSSPEPHQRFQSVLLAHTGLDIYALHRREVVAKTGVYQPHYGSEKVFLGELALLGKYYEIPETLFLLRVHPKASGSLKTEQELQDYIDPRVKPRFTFMRWRLLRAHWQAVHRFDIGTSERLRCYKVLLRYLLQVSKWKKVLKATFRKQGTGGGYHTYLSEIEKESRQKTSANCGTTAAKNSCAASLKTADKKAEKLQCES